MTANVQYFDPREYFADELTARGMELKDCVGTIRRWYLSEAPMTPLVAHAVGVMFDTSPDGWLRLDAIWQSRPDEKAKP